MSAGRRQISGTGEKPASGRRGRLATTVGKAVRAVLQQGLGPEQIALTICVGTAIGTLPLLGVTTILCAALAAVLKLNQAAMQAVNYLVYPLQIALFVPFFKLGSRCLPGGPSLSDAVLQSALHLHFTGATTALVSLTLKALAAWLVTVPPTAALLYPLLVYLLRKRRGRATEVTDD